LFVKINLGNGIMFGKADFGTDEFGGASLG